LRVPSTRATGCVFGLAAPRLPVLSRLGFHVGERAGSAFAGMAAVGLLAVVLRLVLAMAMLALAARS
jgi:hypothetical protein